MSNHDELMSNYFAQPDALAYGKVQLFLLFSSKLYNIYQIKVTKAKVMKSVSTLLSLL